jgi:hypothetical protein
MWCPVMSVCLDAEVKQAVTSGVPRGGSGVPFPHQKFGNFDKAKLNFLFRGKYIHNNRIRIWVSLICKLSETPD